MKEIIITKNDAGQRLDRFLRKYMAGAPLSAVYKAIRKDIKVNGKRSKEDYMLCEGDVLSLYMDSEFIENSTKKKPRAKAKKQFTICYEDDNLIAVNKPYGLMVHGDETEKKNTLANQVVDYLIENGSYVPRLEKSFVPSPVHRLDRNTTGLVVFGKNAAVLRALSAMLASENKIEKYYLAICKGKITEEQLLEGYIVKDERTNTSRIAQKCSDASKYVATKVVPLCFAKGCSLVRVQLITGRSHQIRVHLASIGCPILGDPKYNRSANPNGGGNSAQMLHAFELRFAEAPEGFDYLRGLRITADVPETFKSRALDIFGPEIEDIL